jgi:hypothetical protein
MHRKRRGITGDEMSEQHTPIIDRTHPNHGSGVQRVYRFANGFGASVVRTPYSYGGDHGLYELAVVIFAGPDSDDYTLTYETPITSDVEGYLDESKVSELLDQIAALSETGATQ